MKISSNDIEDLTPFSNLNTINGEFAISNCNSFVHINYNYSSESFTKQASKNITAINYISGTTSLILKAPVIELVPDFKTETGVFFKAQSGGCN